MRHSGGRAVSDTDGDPGAKVVIHRTMDVSVDASDGGTPWSADTAH
jgi:hypothetical protein